MNHDTFFAGIKPKLFNGGFAPGQVDGINAILSEWEKRRLSDLRWLAYIFATVYHETGRTMAPVPEVGRGRGHPYAKKDSRTGEIYYGRGWPQLTWYANYQKQEKKIGLPLTTKPDLMLTVSVSAMVTFGGMIDGDFTGKKLSDYINAKGCDYKGARRIINGLDKAVTIAGYAVAFERALKDADDMPAITRPGPVILPPDKPRQPDDPGPETTPQPSQSEGFFLRFIRWLFG